MNLEMKSPNEPRPSRKNAIFLVMIVMFSSILGWIVSGIFHEIGHALAVASFGGIITEFQPFVVAGAPHISYDGRFSSTQKAAISLSGAGIVYLIGISVLLFFPFRKVSPWIGLVATVGIVPFVAQSISYTLLPVLYMLGVSVQDDVINFIRFSGLNPVLVALGASLAVFLAACLIKRTRILSTIQTVATR